MARNEPEISNIRGLCLNFNVQALLRISWNDLRKMKGKSKKVLRAFE